MNPKIGCGMQQAHELSVEKAVEVVRDHEDGTSGSLGNDLPKVKGGAT